MNILKSFLIKALIVIVGIIFVIGIIALNIKLQSTFKLTDARLLVFIPFFIVYLSTMNYSIKKKEYWSILGSILIVGVGLIIYFNIVFKNEISPVEFVFSIVINLIIAMIIFIITMIILYLLYIRQNMKLNKILFKDKNSELYINKVEELIKKATNETTKCSWKIKKVQGLFSLKRYKECIEILSEMEFDKMGNVTQLNYYVFIMSCYFNTDNLDKVNIYLNKLKEFEVKSNKIYIYYINLLLYFFTMMGRLDEAKEVYNKNKFIFNKNSDLYIKIGVTDTLATYNYFCGNINESRRMFLEIHNKKDDSENVSGNYFLGLIFIEEGKENEAKIRFEKVLEYGKNGYFYKRVIEKDYELKLNLRNIENN